VNHTINIWKWKRRDYKRLQRIRAEQAADMPPLELIEQGD